MKRFFGIFAFCAVLIMIPAGFVAAQDTQDGNATWYKTDTLDLSASHARLPLGTQLRVINLENNREVTVTVTNRIPAGGDRILDLSAEAAKVIEMKETGSTRIRYEVAMPNIAPVAIQPADSVSVAEPTAVAVIESPADVSAPTVTEPPAPAEEITVFVTEAVPEPLPPADAPETERLPAADESPVTETVFAPRPSVGTEVPPAVEEDESTPAPQPPVKTEVPPAAAEIASAPQPPVRTEIPPAASAAQVNQKTVFQAAPPVLPPKMPEPAVQQPPVSPSPAVSIRTIPENMTIRVIIDVNGQEHVVNIPPASAPAAVKPVKPAEPAPAPSPAVVAPILPGARAAKIVPKMPDVRSGKMYRVQVGAFSSTTFAQGCYNKLQSAGFSPAFERNGRMYRVVISGVPAAQIAGIAQRLGGLGFAEAWVREEN